MDSVFCINCLEEALRHHGTPEMHNSDQGSQFTSLAYTDVLQSEGVVISMDCRCRAFDNILVERLWHSLKHEDIYLKGYATMGEVVIGLTAYFAFYNEERPRQSLQNKTPVAVYQAASGGGAMILEKYAHSVPKVKAPATQNLKTGQRRPAANEIEPTA